MRRRALLGIGLLLAAACGSGSGGANTSPGSSPTAAKSPAVPALIFPITGVGAGNAGVSGSAEVTKAADHFTVRIRLRGMAPGTTHVDHIHTGTCINTGGIVYALATLIADASGAADATTDLQHPYVGDGWYANVHMGPDLATPENRAPLACGNLAA